jgi:hypothetical protein
MLATANAFLDLVCAALSAGAMFGLWLGLHGHRLPASFYVAQQQQLIRSMNVAMPLLGAATILSTLLSAFLAIEERTRLVLLLTSAACFLVAGLITRFSNQPINAVVMTWPIQAPPAGWEALRDAWWRWHVRRTLFGIAGLCALVAATLLAVGGG